MLSESSRLTALQNLSSRSTPKVQIVVLKFDNSFKYNDNRIILFNQAIYHTIANLIRQAIDSMKNQTKSIAENWKMRLVKVTASNQKLKKAGIYRMGVRKGMLLKVNKFINCTVHMDSMTIIPENLIYFLTQDEVDQLIKDAKK